MGEWQDKVEGKVKEGVGSVTGDDSTRTEGKAQQTKGQAEGAWNDAKGAAKNAVDTLTDDEDDKTT